MGRNAKLSVGDRVGVLLGTDGATVRLIGYGTYEGEEVPPEDIGGMNIGLPNPKLKLDDGTIVWGCESWFGPEQNIREMCAATGIRVIAVDIHKEREKEKAALSSWLAAVQDYDSIDEDV